MINFHQDYEYITSFQIRYGIAFANKVLEMFERI